MILVDGGEGQAQWIDAVELYPYDAGRRVILPALRKKNISTLDLVVVTHPHSDHLGGLLDVLADPAITIRQVWDSGVISIGRQFSYPTVTQFKTVIDSRKIPVAVPEEGRSVEWAKGVTAEVLHVDPMAKETNDASLVVRLHYGESALLLTGDAQGDSPKSAQIKMLAQYRDRLASDVLKAPHHGSRDSALADFLAAVHPKYAVISCGDYNGYNHPHPETIEAYRTLGVTVLRTDLDSHIEMSSDGKKWTVRTAAKGEVDLPRAKFEAPEVPVASIKDQLGRWVTMIGTVTAVEEAGRRKDSHILTLDGTARVFMARGREKGVLPEGHALRELMGKKVRVSGAVRDKPYGLQMALSSPRLLQVLP